MRERNRGDRIGLPSRRARLTGQVRFALRVGRGARVRGARCKQSVPVAGGWRSSQVAVLVHGWIGRWGEGDGTETGGVGLVRGGQTWLDSRVGHLEAVSSAVRADLLFEFRRT